jgi:uncharacterized protein YjbJ (UPF0337 family)
MNDIHKAQLRVLRGSAMELWGRLTHDPWQRIAGRRERLLGEFEASLAVSKEKLATSELKKK